MQLSDFDFTLPDQQVARWPTDRRDESRLFYLDRKGGHAHWRFSQLCELLRPDDLLVMNNSAVLPARLITKKEGTGGRVELLLVEPLIEGKPEWLALLGASKRVKPGQGLLLEGGERIEATQDRGEGFYVVRLPASADDLVDRYGKLPLPPYLGREADEKDRIRYQTVYADPARRRSVAAPTAGLHFTERLLAELDGRSIQRLNITLHVGPGTFLPVRSDRVEDHRMHSERFEVSEEVAEALTLARAQERRIVAVGTTSVRVLESFDGRPGWGSTDLFIRPGHRFRWVDAMITNFHLPRSTLLMLVSAFAGQERVLSAYREAVQAGYRFFSYGDAMLVEASE